MTLRRFLEGLWTVLICLPAADDAGLSLAVAPVAVYGAAALGSAALRALGGRRKNPGYFTPSKARVGEYGEMEYEDIKRLRGPDPYGGEDLGFGKGVMEARMGEGASEAQAEYRSDLGALERNVSRSPTMALSGSYLRGKQRALQGLLARTADIRRRNLIADAFQRRADYRFRLGAVQDAYGTAASLYNAARGAKVAARDATRSAYLGAGADLLANVAVGGGRPTAGLIPPPPR